jgi:nicotinamide mononucleotide transporter
MQFFQIENIAFHVMGYPLSHIELIGTLFGLICVYYAYKADILTWPTGIINELFMFILFYQVQLYADMFLQIYFLIVTIFGWYKWKSNTANVPITSAGKSAIKLIGLIMVLGTVVVGYVMMHLHEWLPFYFKLPAAYPFADSFVMMGSILATVLLARKQVENWYLWIIVDVVCVVLYAIKGVYFLSLEYMIFLVISTFGLIRWQKQLRHV